MNSESIHINTCDEITYRLTILANYNAIYIIPVKQVQYIRKCDKT